jgi:polysaccharide export outer membrane protein
MNMNNMRSLAALMFLSTASWVGYAPAAFAAEEIPAAGAPVSADYLIGPGDMLQVFVSRHPELTVTVPVRPDGKITTPLSEDLVAVGKSPSILARDVEAVLGEFVRNPQVNVIVTQAASALNQIKVMGQVRAPQALPFREGMTVADAILAVGGLAEFAAGNRAKLIREEAGKQKEYRLRLNRLLNDGDLTQDMDLRAGDVIVIPQSRF